MGSTHRGIIRERPPSAQYLVNQIASHAISPVQQVNLSSLLRNRPLVKYQNFHFVFTLYSYFIHRDLELTGLRKPFSTQFKLYLTLSIYLIQLLPGFEISPHVHKFNNSTFAFDVLLSCERVIPVNRIYKSISQLILNRILCICYQLLRDLMSTITAK